MMRNKLAKAGLTAVVLHSGVVSAFGMGELTLDSLLNQPFRAEIPLRDIDELNIDQIRVRLADATAFENAGVDRSQFLSNLQFKVESVGGGNGRILVTSLSSVVEPYLDFIVEARWPNGKMIREYTVLLDLPVYADDSLSQAINLSNATSATSQNVPVQASSPSSSQTREPGGSIGAVTPALPAARISVQQQDLPPAASPGEYRIQNHDTMWRIATMLRPSSYVTTEQTLLALAKKNPKAFINGNVNQIESGYVLLVPSEAEVREIDHQAAVEEIRLQAKEWRGEKVARAAKTKSIRKTVSAASAAPMAPQIDATAKPQMPAPEVADEAVKFSLGGVDDNSANELNTLREQGRENQENLEKSKLENAAMQDRVVEMEKQIQTLQSLIALKNNQLAALQSGRQVLESPVMSAAAIAALKADTMVPPTGAETDGAASPDAAVEIVAATEIAKQNIIDRPVASSKPVLTEPLEALQGWVSKNLLIFVGLLLALLASLLVLIGGRRAAAEDADLAGLDNDLAAGDSADSPSLLASAREFDVDSAGNSSDEMGEEGGADVVFSAEDFDFDKLADDPEPVDGLSAFAEDSIFEESASVNDVEGPAVDAVQAQTVNVVAEAEIYVAYGRYDQAASLLKTAIAQDRDSTELHLKLLDIYLDTRDQNNFVSAYQDLRALNDYDAIAGVKESMSAIEGVSHWLVDDPSISSGNALEVASLDGVASEEIADFDESVLSLDDEELDLDFELDDTLDDNAKRDADAQGNTRVAVSDELVIGADFDADTLAPLDVNLADLDFDFDGDFGGAPKVPSALADGSAKSGDDSAEAFTNAGIISSAGAEIKELDISFDGQEDVNLDADALSELTWSSDDSASLDNDPISFEDEDVPSVDFTGLEVNELESIEGDDLDFVGLELGALESDDRASGVTSEELDLSEFDMDLSDTFDISESPVDANKGSEKLDLELSDFDMSIELSSASEASFAGDALDVDLDASFFVNADLELDESAFPAGDMQVDSGLAADKEEVPAELPTIVAHVAVSDTVNIDGDAIALEDLVFDEFDAGEDDAEGFDLLLDSESGAIKLDLARAYIDMGDSEGAREMLDEVVQEGDAQQQADAQTLLDNIG
ncbi:MAG: pilus assembly protein FimV [Zhongshania sp.]|jgi:pilus assembly protein FimV